MQIWNEVYPVQLGHATILSFEKYLDPLQDEHHILALAPDDTIIGWFVTFERQDDRWFAMLLAHRVKGLGIGSELLRQAKQKYRVLNGWVVAHNDYKLKDGSPYRSPLRFYAKNGFKILKENCLVNPTLEAVQVRWESKDTLKQPSNLNE